MNGTVIGSQLDEADWLQERLAKPEPDNSCCHRWDGAAEAATGQRRGARPAALPATRPLPRLEALPCSLPRPQAASAQAGRVQALTKRRPTLLFPWKLRTPLDMKHPSSKASFNSIAEIELSMRSILSVHPIKGNNRVVQLDGSCSLILQSRRWWN